MRPSLCCFVCMFATGLLRGADLGSPVPIPVQVDSRPASGVNEASASLTPPAALPATLTPSCPCGNRCDCAAGVCPACPVQAAATQPAPRSYRQVWVRGLGWVWMEQSPAFTFGACGACPGGVCSGPCCGR